MFVTVSVFGPVLEDLKTDLEDCSQPLYVSTQAKETARKTSMKHAGVGPEAGRREKRFVLASSSRENLPRVQRPNKNTRK